MKNCEFLFLSNCKKELDQKACLLGLKKLHSKIERTITTQFPPNDRSLEIIVPVCAQKRSQFF
jgi:hypothetical protein